MSQQAQARREFEAALIAKAQSDPAFKQALLKSPKAAIEKELGVSLPANLDLKVLEESATTRFLVLPKPEDNAWSDAELEGVSGGIGFARVTGWTSEAIKSGILSLDSKTTQDVTVNKAKTADKAFNAMDAYIRG